MNESFLKSKFMRWVWAFNGIGLSILIIAALVSEFPLDYIRSMFEEESIERGLIVGKKAERATELKIDLQHLVYQRPTKIHGSKFYYTPIVVQDKDLPKDVLNDLQAAADISIFMIGAAINILFFDEEGEIVRRLLPENGYIDEYMIGSGEYNYYKDESEPMPYALYKIALFDDNGDSRINEEDSTPYYISSLDGTNLKKITPDSLDLMRSWFSEDYGKIFFEEIIEDRDSPLAYQGYFEKTRILYSYNLTTNEFLRFDLFQKEFEDIQNSFKN